MTTLVIRAARTADLATLVEFNRQLALETEDKQLDHGTLEAGVQRVLDDSTRGRYFVAEIDDQVVGQLMHTREWSDWRNGDIWWLQSVFVHRDFRRRGVFRTLFSHLTDQARHEPDVIGLRLYVEHENTIARRTYERLTLQRAGYEVMERLFGS